MLIASGLLMFGFVAYQLWGTGIETARAQNALESEFEELLAATPTTTPPVAPTSTAPTSTASDATIPESTTPRATIPEATVSSGPDGQGTPTPPDPPPVEEGDPVARIEMPAIGVDKIVVAGVDTSDLKKGPGHYPETPLPGQLGNAAIAGHRTTYGQPFFDVDELETGDEIVLTTPSGRFVYRVTGQQIVSPEDYQVVATTDPTVATITLTSCHPKYTARERIVITGELDAAASSTTAAEPVINYGRPLDGAADAETRDPDPTSTVSSAAVPATDVPATDVVAAEGDAETAAIPGSDAVNQEIAEAFSDGWFSDPGANGQVALWGLVLTAIGALSYLVSRRVKRDWVGITVGIVPFMVTLYFFFQNVNRLLPPNL